MLTGSIGMLPSASLDSNNKGLYEPCHGSAPDIAGKGISNPIATIWSVSMMLDHLGEIELAAVLLKAIESVLAEGKIRTPDLGGKANTKQMSQAVIAALRKPEKSAKPASR